MCQVPHENAMRRAMQDSKAGLNRSASQYGFNAKIVVSQVRNRCD
jgi:hypothetical protein